MDSLLLTKLIGFLSLFAIGAISVTVILVKGIKEGKLQSVAPDENAIRIMGLVVILCFTVLLALLDALSESLLAFLSTVAGDSCWDVLKSPNKAAQADIGSAGAAALFTLSLPTEPCVPVRTPLLT